ncbi:MAG: hypothetical protein JOS17DRAFT_738499 [Linnemannia elongata]|nr:MAG: hypothetical protein JOS17DRAFT_738499 [Linnemannia elongata]
MGAKYPCTRSSLSLFFFLSLSFCPFCSPLLSSNLLFCSPFPLCSTHLPLPPPQVPSRSHTLVVCAVILACSPVLLDSFLVPLPL